MSGGRASDQAEQHADHTDHHEDQPDHMEAYFLGLDVHCRTIEDGADCDQKRGFRR